MNESPKTISNDTLVYDSLQLMEASNISQLIVMDSSKYVGIVHLHDILKEGVV